MHVYVICTYLYELLFYLRHTARLAALARSWWRDNKNILLRPSVNTQDAAVDTRVAHTFCTELDLWPRVAKRRLRRSMTSATGTHSSARSWLNNMWMDWRRSADLVTQKKTGIIDGLMAPNAKHSFKKQLVNARFTANQRGAFSDSEPSLRPISVCR